MPIPDETWTKASFSNGTGGNNCVEVWVPEDRSEVVVRNSRDPHRDPLVFTPAEWEAFVKGVKAGEFDLP